MIGKINNIDELNNYLKKYKPLINQYLLPEKEDKSQIKNRRKFSPSDDKFLLQGLNEYGYKDLAKIQRFWLPDKAESELKHRYKNLTCAKAEDNTIKDWKTNCTKPLSQEEKEKLAKGVEWFGEFNRWSMISKCFFPDRSQQFIKSWHNQQNN